MDNKMKKYIIFWLSQSISQLGSAMTSFSLALWAYTVNHSALTVSLMTFCNYVPYIMVSLFTGTFGCLFSIISYIRIKAMQPEKERYKAGFND